MLADPIPTPYTDLVTTFNGTAATGTPHTGVPPPSQTRGIASTSTFVIPYHSRVIRRRTTIRLICYHSHLINDAVFQSRDLQLIRNPIQSYQAEVCGVRPGDLLVIERARVEPLDEIFKIVWRYRRERELAESICTRGCHGTGGRVFEGVGGIVCCGEKGRGGQKHFEVDGEWRRVRASGHDNGCTE